MVSENVFLISVSDISLVFFFFLTESHVVAQAVLDCYVTYTEIIFVIVLTYTTMNFCISSNGFSIRLLVFCI